MNFTNNVGHIVTSTCIIIAVVVLAALNRITGADALAVIGTVGGVSLGGSVASSLAGAPVLGSAVASASPGAATSTPTTTTPTTTPVAVMPPQNTNPGSVV